MNITPINLNNNYNFLQYHNKKSVNISSNNSQSSVLQSNQLSFCGRVSVNSLFTQFNKPIVSKEHLTKWINQFPIEDRKIAMKLASLIDYHTYPEVFEDVQKLHRKLCSELEKDGFDTETFANVDFAKAYTCKSGDVVSYFYRKANKVRNTCFKTMEGLITNTPKDIENRALVILDDYTGTGDQFLSEFYARNQENRNLLNKYKKIYFAPLVANSMAVNKFHLIESGKSDEVADIILKEFPDNHTDGLLKSVLREVSNDKLKMVEGKIEYPLLSKENKQISAKTKAEIEQFLLKYNCGTPFGMGKTQGHTAFFFTIPNNTPDILWNTKMCEKGFFPLLQRTNDISIYPMCQSLPLKEQVW